jgi:hypothetical protein
MRPPNFTSDELWNIEENLLKLTRFNLELETYFNVGLYANNAVDLLIGCAPEIFEIDLLIVQKNNERDHSLFFSQANPPNANFVQLYKNANDDKSHYQLIVPDEHYGPQEIEDQEQSVQDGNEISSGNI